MPTIARQEKETIDEIIEQYKDAVLWSNEDGKIEAFIKLAKRAEALEKGQGRL